MASESERKYDEISRRLGVVQEVKILVLMLIFLASQDALEVMQVTE